MEAILSPETAQTLEVRVGGATLRPVVTGGYLQSLGAVEVAGVPLRNAATRFLPWIDAYEGGIFNRFRFLGIEAVGQGAVIRTEAVDDNDYPFRERRDASGDICFRAANWDAPPARALLDIRLEPATREIDGRRFEGFRYWFEWSSSGAPIPIHRLLDRQTWEVGGKLDGVTLFCRNWLTKPRVALSTESEFSTVGLDQWAELLPGNLWGRWSLLPSFDLQCGPRGVLWGCFDEVSLIRSALASNRGEAQLRVLDLHLFEQAERVATNPKNILFRPDAVNEIEAINLWTRIHDQEALRARTQFQFLEDRPTALILSQNNWKKIDFTTTYQYALEVAAEFGMDYIFIDSVFEHQQAYCEALHNALDSIAPAAERDPIFGKMQDQNMCVTLDFEVARQWGGEEGLKALCDQAGARGVGIISWMAAHLSPNSALRDDGTLGGGGNGIFAAKESGRHPDTGYASSCWTLNLNTPMLQKITDQLIGVCRRTGLRGYLWDSFSNLGWWQVDYSQGTMRPQFDRMMQLFRDMETAGLYVMPEALVQFSSHNCCGLHGGDIYAGDMAPFAYATNIYLAHDEFQERNTPENRVLRGEAPIGLLFEAIAHRRIPSCAFHLVPRDEWDPAAAAQIGELFRVYKENREHMKRRTLLPGGTAVLWEGDQAIRLLFVLAEQPAPLPGQWTDAATGQSIPSGGTLRAWRVYRSV